MRVSNVTVRKRLLIALFVGILIFFVIDVRLGYVQFFLGDMLTDLAKGSWSRNVPFAPQRGEIIDRNGVALATNISAPTVYVVPRQSSERPSIHRGKTGVCFKYAEGKGLPGYYC